MGNTRWAIISQSALNWLFPPRCAGCGRMGATWCEKCQRSVALIADPICQRCGLPNFKGNCAACAHLDYAFDIARSWAVYRGELRQAILSLKHRRNRTLALQFVDPLHKLLLKQEWSFDAVVPIPLDRGRLQSRGYNQVELFAKPLAEAVSQPYAEKMLTRVQATTPQFELDARARWANLQGSFLSGPEAKGRRVVVVDDIMTTGATLSAAAEALKTAGADKVFALTVARTLFEGDR